MRRPRSWWPWLLEGFSAVLHNDWADAADALRRAWETPIAPDAPPMLHHNLAIATMHLGDDNRAIRLHDLQLQHARDASAINMIEHALTRGVVFRIATGAWTQAASYAQEAVLLDRNLGLDELVTFPLAELATIAALGVTRRHRSTSRSWSAPSSSTRRAAQSSGSSPG